jgi:gas vesicle protein
MNRAIIGALVGVITLATISWTSATENSPTISDINAIRDPYEQCLAYVKLKKIENIDCRAKVAEIIKNTRSGAILIGTGSTKPRIPELPKPYHPLTETGTTTGTGIKQDRPECRAPGSCGQGLPPIATQMGHDMQYIGAALMKLNDADRAELIKIIAAYLNSKGIKAPAQDIVNDRKEEIKNIRNEMKDTVKEIKVKNRDEIRAQQEAYRAKIQEMKKNPSTM